MVYDYTLPLFLLDVQLPPTNPLSACSEVRNTARHCANGSATVLTLHTLGRAESKNWPYISLLLKQLRVNCLSIQSSGRTADLTWDSDRSNEKIPWKQNSASLPELTNPISLFTLVLHEVQLWRGWWTFPLQLLTQPELLRPQALLSAQDGELER